MRLLCVLLALLVPTAYAEDTDESRRTLKGIEHLRFSISGSENFLGDQVPGLTRRGVQADVELRLRIAGIRVSDEGGEPYIAAQVSVYREGRTYAAFIELKCLQAVKLVRDPATVMLAPTWSASVLIAGGRDDRDFLQTVRDQLKELADRFANAYLSGNPK